MPLTSPDDRNTTSVIGVRPRTVGGYLRLAGVPAHLLWIDLLLFREPLDSYF
jgi:hypothetical protein